MRLLYLAVLAVAATGTSEHLRDVNQVMTEETIEVSAEVPEEVPVEQPDHMTSHSPLTATPIYSVPK